MTARAGFAVTYYGDGSNLTGVVSGIGLSEGGTAKGSSITDVNFVGATVTATGAGATITISAGIGTNAQTGSTQTVTLDLSSAEDHKVTITGITTIDCAGGTEGESHTVRVINSGIATVGFSTYFLFPSGATPSLPTAVGGKSLISFTINRVGGAGTELFAGASVNYS